MKFETAITVNLPVLLILFTFLTLLMARRQIRSAFAILEKIGPEPPDHKVPLLNPAIVVIFKECFPV